MDGQRQPENDRSFWKKNSKTVPGRPSPKKDVSVAVKTKPATTTSFQDFQASVSDAWDIDDDEFTIMTGIEKTRISKKVSEAAALNVINSHRNSEASCDALPPKKPSYPEMEIVRSRFPGRPHQLHCTNQQDVDCDSKLERFETLLTGSPSMNDLCALSWSGIPVKVRPIAWRLLLGYLPVNLERRGDTLERKRHDYWSSVRQYYEQKKDGEEYYETYHQIHIDVPRMNPSVPLFQLKTVQQMFERILFIWAIRHPASGYVQGINDLVTPFYIVFLQEMIGNDTPFETYNIDSLEQEKRDIIEADSFWCLSKFLNGIQDNYVFAQLGIQRKVQQLKSLIERVDNELHKHLVFHNVDYLQFSFRWLNNLLTRELPLRCAIRLWDTYLAECDSFALFQLYVCAAFLLHWRAQLLNQKDFQGLMILLQNLPTRDWTGEDIVLLIADAHRLKELFANAPNHLQSGQVPS